MRRFASVFALRKPSSSASESSTDDQNSVKKSWRKWLNNPKQQPHQRREEKRPLVDDVDDGVDELDTSMVLALTRDSLATLPTGPLSPFVEPEGPMFPRSVNTPLVLSRQQSLRVRILKSSLLRHHSKSSTSAIPPLFPPSSDFPNISRPKTPVHLASRGIDRWITRPCFEERYLVYLPSPSGIQPKHVSASLAVAALEYPDHLDVMAHSDILAHRDKPETAMSSLPSVPEPPRTSQKSLASPLRNEHLPPVPALPTSVITETVAPTPSTGPVKRIVRFAQEDDDDDSSDDSVPLHFIRQKNQRQEKVKFLQHERLRRGREEEERKKQAAEREKQRVLLEAKRAQAEKERKEREQTAYAEEVVKTRIRREMHRAGGIPALVMRERENNFGVSSSASERNKPPLATSSSVASLKGVASSSANPPSDSLSHAHQLQATSDSSPSSSRPSSMLAPSPVSQTTGQRYQSHSRPPSTYSSSSESGGKRNSSMVMPSSLMGTAPVTMTVPMNMSAYPVPSPMIMTYPPFATSNPNISYTTPVVPFFPDYMASDFDMPLLPPAAPFMKQPSYERRKSSASSPGSERNASGFASTPTSTDSSRRGSFSSSSEKLDQIGRQGTPRKASEPISSWRRSAVQSSSQSQRSASGPASVSSKDRSRFSDPMPAKSATMPPMPSPWTGVPTAQQLQMETQVQARAGGMWTKRPNVVPQMVPSGGESRTSLKSMDGGSTTRSGGSSSTLTRRGSGVVNRANYSARGQRQVAIS